MNKEQKVKHDKAILETMDKIITYIWIFNVSFIILIPLAIILALK